MAGHRRAAEPVEAGRGAAAFLDEDARVVAGPGKVRLVWESGEAVVRLHRPCVGGRQRHGAQHPAALRTLQPPREGRIDTVAKKVGGLGPPLFFPDPGQLPHLVQVIVPLRAPTTLHPGCDGMHAVGGGDGPGVP
jgi:hypothetical protein